MNQLVLNAFRHTLQVCGIAFCLLFSFEVHAEERERPHFRFSSDNGERNELSQINPVVAPSLKQELLDDLCEFPDGAQARPPQPSSASSNSSGGM